MRSYGTEGVLARNLHKSEETSRYNGDVSMSPDVEKPVLPPPRVNLSKLKLSSAAALSSNGQRGRFGMSPRRTRSHTGRLADMIRDDGNVIGRVRSPSSPAAPLSPPLNSEADVKRTVVRFITYFVVCMCRVSFFALLLLMFLGVQESRSP